MKLNFLASGDKIVLSCINSKATVQAKFFNSNLNLINSNTYQQFAQCSSIYGHSIIQYNTDYYVISDVKCDNYKRCYEPLEGELSPIEIIYTTQKVEYFVKEEEKEIEEEKFKEEEKIEEIDIKEENFEEFLKELEKEMKIEALKEKEEELNELFEEMLIENIIEEEITQIIEEKFNCSDLEKCEECDEESFNKKLCIKCNHERKYYYLNYFNSEQRNKYINCVDEKTKPQKFYFNEKKLDYEQCFITCSSCKYGGNFEENNCTSCDELYYIKNPEEENSTNCVLRCQNFYYIKDGIYTCTEKEFCPEDYSYIIKEKSKCINNCKEDKEYKYRYNGECFNQCPNNTKDDNDFICKDINIHKCQLTKSNAYFINDNITFDEVEKLVIKYIDEFNYTNDHVSLYKNDDYSITIYINNKCILELGIGIPEIDFGSCYEKVKNNEISNQRELIIAIIDKKIDLKNTKKVIKYGIFSPITGKYLNSDELCKDDKITIIDSIEDKLSEAKVNLKILKEFVNEGIDVFNMSSPFYNDICFQYNSQKDIALKDRILEYFPNITLCEEGCDLMGINMTSITAICECFYSESKKEDNLKEKILDQAELGTLEKIISRSNIYVVKCINLVLNVDTIKRAYGGYIIFILIIFEIICTIIYCKKDVNSINRYITGITDKYINSLIKQNPNNTITRSNTKNKPDIIIFETKNKINYPQKQNIEKTFDHKFSGKRLITRRILFERRNKINRKNDLFNYNGDKNIEDENSNGINIINKINHINAINKFEINKDKRLPYNSNGNLDIGLSNSSRKGLIKEEQPEKLNVNNNLIIETNKDIDINIEDYLETQYDEMEYDEAVRRDHRKFCDCYKEKLKENQIIINILYSYNPIRPKSIKIIFLIMQVDLYFFINGLFYDEEYISNIYHLEKDTFFTMAGRFFDNLIYAALASIIINYIIEFFFIDEKKIKTIFKYDKDNILVLKDEISKILKSIKIRYILFIIIAYLISLIALVHIFCFNIVYYHTMVEWIIFSLIIIVSIQILSFLICFLQTALRLVSFKFKNEKLYKLSL